MSFEIDSDHNMLGLDRRNNLKFHYIHKKLRLRRMKFHITNLVWRERRLHMKMIRAILRPETTDEVTEELAEAGFLSLTKINVFGRGKQKGITLGTTHYDELSKTMIMLVVEDHSVEEVVKLVKCKAYTGNYGDGKIFVTPVDNAYTIRTGAAGL
jgi:nitrogen regulatory protein PII 1